MHTAILITGASGGLGAEFAKLAAADGQSLILVARRGDALETLAGELRSAYGIDVLTIACDLAERDAARSIAGRIEQEGMTVTMLINNAGIGLYGAFTETALEQERAMMELNMLALTELTKHVLPGMIAAKSGRILTVASTAAFSPGPLMAVYFASKAYVLSFSVALAEELKAAGVTVTCLCPGPTRTGFAARAEATGTRLFRGSVMDAPTVAAAGYRACKRGKRIVVPGLRNKIMTFGTRLVPRSLAAAIAERAVRAG